MSKAIDDLGREHEAILFTLDVLERMAALIAEGKSLEAEDPPKLLAVLREFADTCHHGKEENILFPAMEAAGIPRERGPIGQMLAEHEAGREHIRKMGAAAKAGDYPAFAREARAYVELLRQHIEKENTVLFPMGERTLDAGTLERVMRKFDEHEERVIGAGRHEELHAILEDFGRRYLPGR